MAGFAVSIGRVAADAPVSWAPMSLTPDARRLRSILVTGSGSGIGAAIARRLARPGVGVLVHALAGDSAAEWVGRRGGQRGLIAGDVIAELRRWVNP